MVTTLDQPEDRMAAVRIDKGPLTVTISIGVATSVAGDTAQTLLKRADLALYRAKKEGRNRVRLGRVRDPL
jgi:diguanylate cyclase (GGDEF)-like protein